MTTQSTVSGMLNCSRCLNVGIDFAGVLRVPHAKMTVLGEVLASAVCPPLSGQFNRDCFRIMRQHGVCIADQVSFSATFSDDWDFEPVVHR